MSDRMPAWLIATVVVCLIVGLAVGINITIQSRKCAARGGVLVRGAVTYVCVATPGARQ